MTLQHRFEPPLSPPEPRYVLCVRCESELYEGETAYRLNSADDPICGQCLDEYFSDLRRNEKAQLVGAEEKTIVF